MTASIASWARLLCAGALILAPAFAVHAEDCVGSPSAARLRILVDGVRSDKGLMTATLYPGDAGKFLKKDGALKVWRDPAHPPTTAMCIWLPGPGTYALAIYHDANANMKLDRGMFGPTEAYGFSNNPKVRFAPPVYDAVKFQANEGDTTVHVNLHYP